MTTLSLLILTQISTLSRLALLLITARLAAATSQTASCDNAPSSVPAFTGINNPVRLPPTLASLLQALSTVIQARFRRAISGQLSAWDMVQLLAAFAALEGLRRWRRKSITESNKSEIRHVESVGRRSAESVRDQAGRKTRFDATLTDPGLLKKHSTDKSYATSIATYPSIRTFYRPHPQADKLPSKPSLPLLVFVHGLGGSLAQFNPILTTLVNVAPCLGIDLPGCGRSSFEPTSWSAYTPEALSELLSVVIRQHCSPDQGIILIGHSFGCSLSVLLASRLLPRSQNSSPEVLGMVAICPSAERPSGRQRTIFQTILLVPTPIFNLWRLWDKRGGPHSNSVRRFVGSGAGLDVKKLQEKFNTQSRTAVWRRMAWGILSNKTQAHASGLGSLGHDEWSSLKLPLFLIGGEADAITKVDQIEGIRTALENVRKSQDKSPIAFPDSGSADSKTDEAAVVSPTASETLLLGAEEKGTTVPNGTPHYTIRRQVLKTYILPIPASHALLYDPATSRTLAGLIHTFLYEHIDTRLSLGFQLQHLSTEGKWDVKNVIKWQAVRPVSEPIAGIFRAMKTLREIDDSHSPEAFVKQWRGKIKAVIDISHESPVYDPKGLEDGGIEYHKIPTVSKIPPTLDETNEFANLIDRLRAQPSSPPHTTTTTTKTDPNNPNPNSNPADPSTSPSPDPTPLIGIHCHYGFNRTGFFICAYLIEREHYTVQEAIDTFAAARPPGIRHEHFLDQLFVGYCVGLKGVGGEG